VNTFEPSPDFVVRVMGRVRAYEQAQAGLVLGCLRILAAGWALFGMLRAIPAF